jgi:AraC-like DNA-binding protein
MPTFLNDPAAGAAAGADSIRFGPGAPGIERAAVRLSARGFEPHRHDTYGLGITTSGVQTFGYRGLRRVCIPGEWHVLHPDELHDGVPGTERGFAYRILYLAPELVREALGGGALPFVAEPVHGPTPFTTAVEPFLAELDEPISDLGRAELAAAAADALRALAGRPVPQERRIDARAVELVRDHLASQFAEQTSAATLERIAGTDRFTITRHFRRAFGTTPDRYRTMRRLEAARARVQAGQPLARIAADAGFADQSHMNRQFRRAYGMTPGRWAALTAAGGA